MKWGSTKSLSHVDKGNNMNNMNLSTYLGLAFVASLQSATVQQELVRHHTGAPLQVVAIGCGPDELLRQLVVVNSSKSVAFSGLPFDLNLAPGDFVVVGRQGASISSIKATMQSNTA